MIPNQEFSRTRDLPRTPGNNPSPPPTCLTRAVRAALVSAAAISLATQASAATFTVDSTDDTIPPMTGDGCSLREAINSLNSATLSPDCPNTGDPFGIDDRIEFDASLIGQTINMNGVEYSITVPMLLIGPDPGAPSGITLAGGGVSRIFNVSASSPGEFDVVFADMTLSGGSTTQTGEPGGAIRSSNANIGVSTSLVTGNSTTGGNSPGGGIHVTGGDLMLQGTAVRLNETQGSGSAGGGVAVVDGELLSLVSDISFNATFEDNSGGGGVFVNLGTATLVDSTISSNDTLGNGSDGGGLAVALGSGALNLIGSTVDTNLTQGEGSRGGGIFFGSGDAVLINSTVSGNITQGGDNALGGGVYLGSGQSELIHVTVAENTAEQNDADGIFKLAGLQLLNSLVVQSDPTEVACSNAAATATGSRATDANCGATVSTPGAIDLQPLADNGGPTLTRAPGAGSTAIDIAPNGPLCSDDPPDGAGGVDQRGVSRPGGAACDAGAFETSGPPPIAVSLSIAPDPAELPEGAGQSATVSACLPSPMDVPVMVELAVTGTATPLVDHDLANPTLVTILSGNACGEVDLTPIDDPVPEADETVDLTIVTATTPNVGLILRGPVAVSATILDDDVAGEPDVRSIPAMGPWGFVLLPLALMALAWRRLWHSDS